MHNEKIAATPNSQLRVAYQATTWRETPRTDVAAQNSSVKAMARRIMGTAQIKPPAEIVEL